MWYYWLVIAIYDMFYGGKMTCLINIIVPCFNEEQCIKLFFESINKTFEQINGYDYSLLFVNDGSKDSTLSEIKDLVKQEGATKIHYISFSRNFGKEAAIYAGLSHCEGDLVVLMDADLQHPPELIPEMIKAIEEEKYDSCAARRVNRKGEPIIRSFFSRTFYRVINRMTVIDLVQGSTDYRMMTRKMADAVVSLSENERFTKGIYAWVGFNTKWISYENRERAAGKTKWSFMNLFNYASNGIIAFATTPLRGAIWIGMITVVISIIYAIFTAIQVLAHPENSTGRATILLVVIFLGGVIITLLGIIGEYLARIYMEVKKRPIYIEKESNLGKDSVDDK